MNLAARDQESISLVPWTSCCHYNIWYPLWNYCAENGYSLLLRGTKGADEIKGVDSGFEFDGIEVVNPIQDWTHDEVFAYLEERGITLPKQYEYFKDSLDCICCTAPLFGGYDKAKARLKFIKKYYPLQYESLIKTLDDIYTVSLTEVVSFGRLIEEVSDERVG